MSDEGRLVADRYRIIERIGTGAMGAVWQAQDEVLHRTVAIKQLLLQPGLDEHEAEDARQRTMREGRIAARLHHPNAISVFDVVTDEHSQPCLIMEYLASTSLAAMLQEHKTLPPLEVARIGAQIASALKDAHSVGVVHRDIKPGNVLLADNGTVKLTDFGISRATDDVTVTKTGMIAGTPAYLAPEVAIGGDPGPESDVFALGSTLYAATEGQPPFGLSENTLSLLHAVAAGQINPPRQSGPLASVLAVMLHPEIGHRPTAEESEDLLAAVARGETPLGGPSDGTLLAAAPAGAAAMGAAAGTLGGADTHGGYLDEQDYYDEHHSGTLGDDATAAYGTATEEAPFPPGDGYPDQDYDRYYPADPYDATRAVPVGTAGYDDPYFDDPYDDDPYDSPTDDDHRTTFAAPVDDDDDDERGNWKIPAAVGAVTVIGLIALAIWIFSPPSGGDEANQPPAPAPSTTSSTTTSSSESSSSTTTSSTTTSTTTEQQQSGGNTGGGWQNEPTNDQGATSTESQPTLTETSPPPDTSDPSEPPSSSSHTTSSTTSSSKTGSTQGNSHQS